MIQGALKTTGAPSLEELKKSPAFPRAEDYQIGPIAVIECIEEIPCNPCETSCPKGSISIGKPITNLPRIDFNRCSGCGICVAACPGLAIYIKDYTYSQDEALVTFPYEYIPLPEPGDTVILVNRQGQEICEGLVKKVNSAKAFQQTTLVSVSYPKQHFEEVVNMKRR
ncbi:4Fe-4S binding domain-containing protein [Geosporobacter subterraneus DSM 17957]|uniref:4Fe-4S binding domain-containing protein n=1 Tax=Geosporobacter subterraneus DSM 17957 TaxID=1121919 RepID=A0A1M6PPA5_9FIRM|nr:4Fe-4S binding protein [Geosporobacter subterraneus]SHK09741.1 4Fe-4S binding domain-containing protein [Geosporobacter subterraneus DSM 17957]